jgi:hypothetical protein
VISTSSSLSVGDAFTTEQSANSRLEKLWRFRELLFSGTSIFENFLRGFCYLLL